MATVWTIFSCMCLKTRVTAHLPAKTRVFVIRSCMSRAGRVQSGRPLGPTLLPSVAQPPRVCGFCLHAPCGAREGRSASSRGPVLQQRAGGRWGTAGGGPCQPVLPPRRPSLRPPEHLQLCPPKLPREGRRTRRGPGGHVATPRRCNGGDDCLGTKERGVWRGLVSVRSTLLECS